MTELFFVVGKLFFGFIIGVLTYYFGVSRATELLFDTGRGVDDLIYDLIVGTIYVLGIMFFTVYYF